MIIQTLIKCLWITRSKRLQVRFPSYLYIYKTRWALMPLLVPTTIMPLIKRAMWCIILIMLGIRVPLRKPKLNFSCPLQQLLLIMSYMFGFWSLCKCSLSINFRFISICHCMHSNRRWLFFPKIWLKPISIIYTGQENKIKVDGVFLYCRVNYMTFNMLINLTQVQTASEFLKIAVFKKKDYTELRKEIKKHVAMIFIAQLRGSIRTFQ